MEGTSLYTLIEPLLRQYSAEIENDSKSPKLWQVDLFNNR